MNHRGRRLARLARLLIRAALLWGVASSAAAQTAPPPSRPSAPAALADVLRDGFARYDGGEGEAADGLFAQALTLAEAAGDRRAEGEAYRGLGLIRLAKADYPAARRDFEQALARFDDPADRARVEQHLGYLETAVGDWPAARIRYRSAFEKYQAGSNARSQARVLFALSRDPGIDGDEERKLAEQAEAIAVRVGDKDLEAELLNNGADSDFTHGNFADAIAKLERAVALFEEIADREGLAGALTSLGRIQRAHGYPERALELYRRALSLQQQVGDQRGQIQSINAIAVTDELLNRRADALAEYERAYALALKTGSARLVNFTRGNLGGAYLGGPEIVQGVALIENVVKDETSPYLLSYRYGALGEAYLTLGRYQDAVDASNRAIELTRVQGAVPNLIGHLDLRARAQQKLGDATGALADEREALRLVEQVRSRLVPTDFMKQGFGTLAQNMFALSIELLQRMGDGAGALEAAEQARSRAFLDLMATRDNLAQKIAEVRPAAPAGPPAPAAHASSTIDGLALTLRGGTGTAETRSAVGRLKSAESAPAFSAADVIATARRLHSTMVMYYVAPAATSVWVVTPDAVVQSARIDVSASRLEELVRATRPEGAFASRGESVSAGADGPPALATRGGDLFFYGSSRTSAWRELYRVLIRPVRQHLPRASGSRITIVPHGPLFLLSFAALQDDNGRYLLEDYTIHYAPTAALLQYTAKARSGHASGAPHYLLVADPADLPADGTAKPLPPLPGARREVRSIASVIPASRRTILTGGSAQESEVLSRMPEASIIHFATHGIIRDDDPFGSFLALGRSHSGEADDGKLTAEKIYGMDLHADTVVLSACRTALGKLSGDGMAGLTRAFFYAGAASVVATMWDVADEPTFQLIPAFYRSVSTGGSKAGGLRRAQLALLARLRAGRVSITSGGRRYTLPEDPFFWAGFVLVGEP